ncbi:hypothetical protein NGA35_17010 [Pseudomonas stutzeri]|nr:hypothetical protein [Stutzerimonas stutzeri]
MGGGHLRLPAAFPQSPAQRRALRFQLRRILALFSLLGPLAGFSGYLWLAPYPEVVGAIMLFASGGILYSVFQDIAPQVRLERHWSPPLGAVAGMLGQHALQH